MRLVYVYHSGFALEGDGFSLLFDYFKDTDPDPSKGYVRRVWLRRQGSLYVFASHFHPDHFNPEVLRWREERPDIHYIFSKDILKRRRAKADDALFLKKGDSYEDGTLRVRVFGSTDVGSSFLVEVGGRRIFHAGDLNNWHWKDESTPEEVSRAESRYLRELEDIARAYPAIDLAMFPVDPRIGSDFDRGARQFMERIRVGTLVPMHFWERPDEVRDLAPFAASRGCRYVVLDTPGKELDFSGGEP